MVLDYITLNFVLSDWIFYQILSLGVNKYSLSINQSLCILSSLTGNQLLHKPLLSHEQRV